MSENAYYRDVGRLLQDHEFLALSTTAFARAMAGATVLIALALYADLFRTTGVVEGLFGTAFALTQFVIVLPLGHYVDAGNAKHYLLAGLLLNVLVFVGFGFVASPTHVVLVRAAQGAAATLVWVTGTAVVGSISPEKSSGLWLGTYNQVDGLFDLLGSLAGGALLQVFGFGVTYGVLAVVSALSAVAVFVLLRDDPGGRKDPDDATALGTLHDLLDRGVLRALVTFRFAYSFGKMAVTIFLPIYARTAFGIPALAIGGILTGGRLVKVLVQGKVGDVSDRVENRYLFVVAGALVFATGTALVPLAPLGSRFFPTVTLAALGYELAVGGPFFVLFAAYTVIGVGDSLRQPVSMALFVDEGERLDAVASSLSLRTVSWKLGEIVGPVLVGLLWDLTSVRTSFWAAAGIVVVGAVGLVGMVRLGATGTAPGITPDD